MTLRERLGCAALASIALHVLALSGSWLAVPGPEAPPTVLTARLARPDIQPAPTQPQPQQRPTRRSAPPAAVHSSPSPTAAPPAAGEAPEAVTQEAPSPSPPPVPEPPQQIARAAEPGPAVARTLPRRGRITYSLLYGESKTYVGRVVQSWEVENDVYRLASEAETAGVVELLSPRRLHYLSRGRITREGLRPESFLMSRTRRGRTEAAQARFDWQAGTIAYGLARDPKSAPLPAGSQDFMSFIFQHALLQPAPGRHRVAITTGPRFEVYEVEVAAEEIIETPLGMLLTLPVRQVPKPGSESVQIWLAADYRYLPVRIRHFDRDGQLSGEQVVNEIRISDE